MRFPLRMLLLALALSAAVVSSCNNTTAIEFVVPKGFRGPFVVVVSDDGAEIDEGRGKYVLSVPKSGILKIKDDTPLFAMMHHAARFSDGSKLPLSYEATSSQVALHSQGHGSERGIQPHHRFFVGTEKEFVRCDYSLFDHELRRENQ